MVPEIFIGKAFFLEGFWGGIVVLDEMANT